MVLQPGFDTCAQDTFTTERLQLRREDFYPSSQRIRCHCNLPICAATCWGRVRGIPLKTLGRQRQGGFQALVVYGRASATTRVQVLVVYGRYWYEEARIVMKHLQCYTPMGWGIYRRHHNIITLKLSSRRGKIHAFFMLDMTATETV